LTGGAGVDCERRQGEGDQQGRDDDRHRPFPRRRDHRREGPGRVAGQDEVFELTGQQNRDA